jgi:DNA primase
VAGKIPQFFIDQLLQQVDIVEIIEQRVPLRKAGKDFHACCPFHDEKTPSFTVSQNKQFYHCFGCGQNGNVISFLMNYDHLEFPDAIEDLAKRQGLEIPYEKGSKPRSASIDYLLPILDQASRWFQQQLRKHPEGKNAINYLKNRGLSGKVAQRFELGFAPDSWDGLINSYDEKSVPTTQLETAGLAIKRDRGGFYDRFRGRVMFPIRDHRGRTVGFGGRIIDQGEPKYLNSPETPLFHKGSELYGLFAAREEIQQQGYAVVVEGYMDVVALAQFEINNAVATLGTATTAQHLQRLFRLTPHVVFCFDGDRAGRDAARKAMSIVLPEMHSGHQVSFLFLPDGMDPDDFVRENSADAFRQAVKESTPLDDFLFQRIDENTDITRRDGRARLIELAKPLISTIPAGPYKVLLTKRLSELSGLDDEKYVDAIMQRKNQKDKQLPNNRNKTKSQPLSPFAYLISLLLQYPNLIKEMPPLDDLDSIDHPAIPPLLDLIARLQTNTESNTASLVEGFRDTKHHARLEKLAVWDHKLVAEENKAVLIQYHNNVRQFIIDQNIDKLLTKAQVVELSDLEKSELRRFTRLKQSLRLDSSDNDC